MQLFLQLTEPSVPPPVSVLKGRACLELMRLIGPGGEDIAEPNAHKTFTGVGSQRACATWPPGEADDGNWNPKTPTA